MTNAFTIGIDLEQGADGRIQFGIHQDHMLAVGDGFQCHPGPKLDLPGSLDHGVNIIRTAKEHGILSDAVRTPADGFLKLGDSVNGGDRIYARLAICPVRFGKGTIGNRHQLHACKGGDNLQGNTPAHITGSDDRRSNGFALFEAFL
jgi:hypothetical protein